MMPPNDFHYTTPKQKPEKNLGLLGLRRPKSASADEGRSHDKKYSWFTKSVKYQDFKGKFGDFETVSFMPLGQDFYSENKTKGICGFFF